MIDTLSCSENSRVKHDNIFAFRMQNPKHVKKVNPYCVSLNAL